MMTRFELAYRCAEPFLPPLYGQVRRQLCDILGALPARVPTVLDIGGRKSHYTIGAPGRLTITDLPRETATQHELNLGLVRDAVELIGARRSNIDRIVFDDMTRTTLPSASFDCALAVEVLEHVDEDRTFLENVRRVLKPGGVFLMTTPNGDSCPIPSNSDHKRHYKRAHLDTLLREVFEEVEVEYAVALGKMRTVGLRSWSVRAPIGTMATMAANVINGAQSARRGVAQRALGTGHLIAVARVSA